MENKIEISSILKRFIIFNMKRIPFIILICFMLIMSALTLSYQQIIIGDLIDVAIKLNLSSLPKLTIKVIIIFLFGFIFDFTSQYISGKFSKQCIKDMKLHTYEILCDAKVSWIENSKVGDLLSRVNTDLTSFEGNLSHLFLYSFSDFIIGFIGTVVCFIINWKLSLISYAMIPLLAIFQKKTGKPIAKYSHLYAQAEGQAIGVSQNLLAGLAVAKAFNIEKETEEKFSYYIDQSVEAGKKSFAIEFVLLPLQISMSYITKFLILGFGGYFVISQNMTVGELITYILLSSIAMRPINNLSWMFRQIYSTCGVAKRIFDIWDAPVENDYGLAYDTLNEVPVQFKNVSFKYDGKDILLSNFNLRIDKGEQVALVGTSGCGKSTVLKLIANFYDIQAGDITLFSHSINHWKLSSLRSNISYVSQDSYIFDGSIYDNILLGNPSATEEEVKNIAKLALLDDLDLYGFIGEGGVQLSGGQRQRISIARAILKNAPLILLDEPTSALDTESEQKVLLALNNLIKGKTSIIVAHRLSAFRHTDRIVCMDDGKIVQQGTHDELINVEGLYRNLYIKQTQQYNS